MTRKNGRDIYPSGKTKRQDKALSRNLFRIKKEDNTNKLLKLIPEAEVQKILEDYAFISGSVSKDSSKQFIKDNLEGHPYPPKKALQKIRKILETLSKSSTAIWLTKQSQAEILKSLAIHLASTDLGRRYIISHFIEINFKTGGRRREKPFLDYLVLRLILLLKEKSEDPHYNLIIGFLEEQGIIEDTDTIDEIALRKRFERATKSLDDIQRIMMNIQKLRVLKINLLLISTASESAFPEWFMPFVMETFNLTLEQKL